MKTKAIFSIVLGVLLASCAAYGPSAGKVVPGPPPPRPHEVDITSPLPGPDYTWVKGAWVWGMDNRWDWIAGHWEFEPFLDAVWVPPTCVKRNEQYIYIAGRWK